MKKNFRNFFLFFLLLGTGAVAVSQQVFAAEGAYYTKVNIWYEKPEKILSTNYHKGSMIPVGSEVRVLKSNSKKIEFMDDKGTKFRIKLVKDYTNLEEQQFFDRYFSKENILNGDQYHSFSNMEKENIKTGTLREGMSKEAVLVAYGYPPTHRTPSTDYDSWVYWKSRMGNFTAMFKDGKLVGSYL